uniref:collagen alpha-3(V) chain-like n=1 Tax=Euleptes europaea TaxID=460621 RepID=UPI0025408335|nr:collagen alpha-3(V) chain-like [Euleptes europaea]
MLPLLLLLLVAGSATGQPRERQFESGSGLQADELNLLDKLASYGQEFGNFSLSYDEANCSVLEVGQYATLTVPSVDIFGESFTDELSLLLTLRYSLKEETSLLTIIGHRSDILFQIRVSPYALVFVASRRRHYEFPISSLADGKWHQVGLSISLERLALYVDCQLVESVGWSSYFGMGVTLEGLLVVGGLIEPFEIPFEGALRQLTFLIGDSGAAREHCQSHNSTCSSPLGKEADHNMPLSWAVFSQAGTQVPNETNEIHESNLKRANMV